MQNWNLIWKLSWGVISVRNCSCIVWPILQGRVVSDLQRRVGLQFRFGRQSFVFCILFLRILYFVLLYLDFVGNNWASILYLCIRILLKTTLSKTRASLLLWLKGLSSPGNTWRKCGHTDSLLLVVNSLKGGRWQGVEMNETLGILIWKNAPQGKC